MKGEKSIINTLGNLRTSWPVLMSTQDVRDKIADIIGNNLSPDIPDLEWKNGHVLFTYGTLKSGFSRHDFLLHEGAQFIAAAATTHTYALYYNPKAKDPFPILIPPIQGHPQGNVLGQLWLVRPKTIIELDKLERNRELYNRMKMNVQVLSKPHHNAFQQYASIYAWGYMGMALAWHWRAINGELDPIHPAKLSSESERNTYINFSTKHAGIGKYAD
jgi:gamma-glutamylcyclotransferase (GGCT)/AIG2-like uncharacterized protein YtfP